ncbi:MAG: D-aminoacylase [Candidatus Neomarinimicrobiota bacterium]
MKTSLRKWIVILIALLLAGCGRYEYDVIIRQGTIYDGSGNPPYVADLAIKGDRIAAISDLDEQRGKLEINAAGMAVSPGFINMLSGARVALIHDGRSLSDIRQGVTLEIISEGTSMGPLNEKMRKSRLERQTSIKYDIPWTTLGGYLQHLEDKGVSANIASFVGATTARIHEVGYANRPATPQELENMQALVRQAMEEGALGVGSALIYAPANYAPMEELIALCKVAAEYDGMYISHMRSEGREIFAALDELLTIARETGIRAEIYHLKVSRPGNWNKLDEVIRRVEAAQAEGLQITADMYTYAASSTGLSAISPTWAQEGGHSAWVKRMQDPVIRPRIRDEIAKELTEQPADGILLVGFRNPDMRHLIGKTLAEVATERNADPAETVMNLVIEDDSRIQCVYFSMTEDNIRKKVALPWVAFCSDGSSIAPEPPFTNSQPHPRAYGSFARLLGKYVREEKIIPLEEAIRRLTLFPASNLKIVDRGSLQEDYFADVVVFDPATITDHATFEEPHQLATGVHHVFVNGIQVLRHGEHTGAFPGRFVKGPGWKKE